MNLPPGVKETDKVILLDGVYKLRGKGA